MKLEGLAFWVVLFTGTALGTIYFEEGFDDGIQTTLSKYLYAISTTFPMFTSENKTLVLQHSVKYEQDIGEDGCAGGFIKLFNCSFQPTDLHGGAPHLLSFGPDICGEGTKRVQISINYKDTMHSINGTIPWKNDIYTYVYTLIMKPDQTYQVLIDSVMVHNGSFLDTEYWNIIPKKIKDPNVTKPSDWDDRPTIPDPNDTKPEDWDQPMYLCPCNACKMTTDLDKPVSCGPPSSIYPDYNGEWKPREIPNPAYKGPWIHPEIDNPEYMQADKSIYKFSDICGIGYELWQEQSGTLFDNLLLTDSIDVAAAKRENLLHIMKEEEKMKELLDQEETPRKSIFGET